MAAARAKGTINPNFTLSARQEELLFAALQSNKMPTIDTSMKNSTDALSMPPSAFTESPAQAPGSGTLGGFEESPYIDYDYEFDADGSFDYDFANDSQGQMIGNLPGTSSDGDGDNHDKRSHPDDDGDEDEGGGKRREGDDKSSKKPGRKPLTSEPTSKRKAQNRAAQRAFRERKEKHLKDLETKVEDLQKASESANHENSILRAQIEKMSTELREYKKRVSLTGSSTRNSTNGLPPYLAGKGLNNTISHPNDVNFQFEFPRFGRLPGPPITNGSASINSSRKSASASPAAQQTQSPIDKSQVSPRNTSLPYSASNGSNSALIHTPSSIDGGDMSGLSGLFSPTLLDSVSKSPPYEFFADTSSINSRPSRSSTDSANGQSTGHNTSYSSPSASSTSGGNGTSSSCGTSPEPTTHQSPATSKPESSLTTIGEEQTGNNLPAGETTFCEKLNMACGNPSNHVPRIMSEAGVNSSGNPDTPGFDVNGIDWFAQQNNNQFDPQLFGDYREPQDNILLNDPWGDTFFTEALATDFNSPFNMAPSPVPKKDLVQQIDEAQEQEDEVVPAEDRSQLLTCNTIWDRLQACPRVQEGGFDLDLLCSDLQKKAKCSETGAVVNETDFNKIIQKYVRESPNGTSKANKA